MPVAAVTVVSPSISQRTSELSNADLPSFIEVPTDASPASENVPAVADGSKRESVAFSETMGRLALLVEPMDNTRLSAVSDVVLDQLEQFVHDLKHDQETLPNPQNTDVELRDTTPTQPPEVDPLDQLGALIDKTLVSNQDHPLLAKQAIMDRSLTNVLEELKALVKEPDAANSSDVFEREQMFTIPEVRSLHILFL